MKKEQNRTKQHLSKVMDPRKGVSVVSQSNLSKMYENIQIKETDKPKKNPLKVEKLRKLNGEDFQIIKPDPTVTVKDLKLSHYRPFQQDDI